MPTENIPSLVLLILAMTSVAMMFNRVWAPFSRRAPGRQVHDTRLTFMQKMLLHRTNMMIALGLANLFWIGRITGITALADLRLTNDGLGEMFVIMAIFAALIMPTRYVFTTEGFALGSGPIHRWDAFTRYGIGQGRIRFETKGDRPTHVDLYMNHVQQSAFRSTLKRYFGKTPPAPRTAARPPT